MSRSALQKEVLEPGFQEGGEFRMIRLEGDLLWRLAEGRRTIRAASAGGAGWEHEAILKALSPRRGIASGNGSEHEGKFQAAGEVCEGLTDWRWRGKLDR